MLSIKFSDAAATLARVTGAVSVAEAHGCLSGALCVTDQYSFARWFDELADDAPADGELASAKDMLKTLHQETMRSLTGGEMEFAPLLPDDDAPLARRAEALAQWCQGFLYGFGSVAGTQRKLPAQVDEILRDFTQISRASAGDTEPSEEDENDYMELVEYVRVGAQLVHDELSAGSES